MDAGNSLNSIYGECNVSNATAKFVRTDTRLSGMPAVDAVMNWWTETSSSTISGKMEANVNWDPFLTAAPTFTLSRGRIGVEPVPELPVARLLGNRPNPFRSATEVQYMVPRDGVRVTIDVYAVTGRLVRSVVQLRSSSGPNGWVWDGRNENGEAQPSGIYYYRVLMGDEFAQSSKMLLVR